MGVAYGTSGTTVCVGNDGRLSDARTPTAHTQAASMISDSTAAGRAVLTAADAAAGRWYGEITSSDDAVVPTAIAAINTDYLLKIEGIAVPSASGNLQVRARTETGTTIVTVRQGSYGMLWNLGT